MIIGGNLMTRKKLSSILILAFLAFLLPDYLLADDNDKKEPSKLKGEMEVTGIVGEGQEDSSKFDEYSDRSDGAQANIKLRYDDQEKGDHLNLDFTNIGRDDQNSSLNAGNYGKYEVDLEYDETPHRFSLDSQTLYSGTGSGTLELPDAMQSQLQQATTPKETADELKNNYIPGTHSEDIELTRKTTKASVRYIDMQPFSLRLDMSHEDREGTRPLMGSFGFSKVNEVFQPINYETTDGRLTFEYAERPYIFSANYYFSFFENDTDNLVFDNPLHLDDTDGDSGRGRLSLAPDNLYHGPSVMASFLDLPWKSRLTINGSWGFMRQDDDFLPYTVNSALTGTTEDGRSFNASDRSGLPKSSPDASVNTQMYNVNWAAAPAERTDLKLRYRYYEYDNNTDSVDFPGAVTFDSSWSDEPIKTLPTSYNKQTASADAGYKITDKTRVGVDYEWQGTHRTNREVDSQTDNTVGTSIDYQLEDMSFKTSYSHLFRRIGDYDFTVPYRDVEGDPPQLPMLRKYDEADRDTDDVNFLVTAEPGEKWDLTGSVTLGHTNYSESDFGLLDDDHYVLSSDIGYNATKWLKLNTFYSFENHNSTQRVREWSSGGAGDPYTLEPGKNSNSNWTADNEDKLHTVGAGANVTLMEKLLFLEMKYDYTRADGNVDFGSPLGTAENDANDFVPTAFNMADDTRLHRADARVRYRLEKNVDLIVGYLWETFDYNDFKATDRNNLVPTKTNGDFNGAVLAGSYPFADYNVNMGYVTLRYKF
jgi:MtrB/PioB family decaheme-associated outer membrane protein